MQVVWSKTWHSGHQQHTWQTHLSIFSPFPSLQLHGLHVSHQTALSALSNLSQPCHMTFLCRTRYPDGPDRRFVWNPNLKWLQDDDRICGQAASVKSNKLCSMRVRKMGPFVAELNKHLCNLKDSSSKKDNRFVQNSTPELTIQIYSILQRLVDAIPLLLSQSHTDVIVKGICCPFEGRNPSNPSTKRESNKNGQFLVAYHHRGDHLCFQGNASVIWIL